MKRLVTIAYVFLLAITVCGCGSKPRAPAVKYRIAVIPKGTTHDHWKSVRAGAIQAAREHGDTKIYYEGPAKEDQSDQQQQIVERFTGEGISAIVLAPLDRKTLVGPVKDSLRKDIPVVIIDSGIQLDEFIEKHPKYLGYVATNNYEGGVAAGKRMVELLKDRPKARVLMIRYQAGSESTEQRERGFEDTIKAAKNIELLIPNTEAGATVDSAQKACEAVLPNYPNLDGIFMPNESSTSGMLSTLRNDKARHAAVKEGKLAFVGFDGSAILIKALENEELHGIVLQDPFDMGYQSVKRALAHLDGQAAPADKTLYTNLAAIHKANMNEPKMKALYARDLKQWLDE